MFHVIYIDNASVLQLSLRNSVTGVLHDGAEVSVALFDIFGELVPGVSWPLPMQPSGEGLYRAVLPHSLSLQAGKFVRARVDAVGSSGEVLRMWARLVAVERVAR